MDTDRLKQEIRRFKFLSRPTSANGSTPCTVQDINNLIDHLSKVLTAIVEELENQ